MNKQREVGYYWVKESEGCQWEIAHYDHRSHRPFEWTVNGTDCGCVDDDMVEINETRILDPDDQTENKIKAERDELRDMFIKSIDEQGDSHPIIKAALKSCSNISPERKEKMQDVPPVKINISGIEYLVPRTYGYTIKEEDRVVDISCDQDWSVGLDIAKNNKSSEREMKPPIGIKPKLIDVTGCKMVLNEQLIKDEAHKWRKETGKQVSMDYTKSTCMDNYLSDAICQRSSEGKYIPIEWVEELNKLRGE